MAFTRFRLLILCVFLQLSQPAISQLPDFVYHSNVHSVRLHKFGDAYTYPILLLNGGEQLELHFDDMDADVKNYYYTYQLCNRDWTPANLQSFDFIRGFQSNRIGTYRHSSVTRSRYTHYQAVLPERNSFPTRSGNYLLKVFLNDDTSQLVFTRRFLVVDNKTQVSAVVQQPFNANLFRTHQRLQVGVNFAGTQVHPFSPQDIKVVLLQNHIWNSALMVDRPSMNRGNYLEYTDDEAMSFAAGREWRWIDLRSLRLLSDRMDSIRNTGDHPQVYVKPDGERRQQVAIYYRDLNGAYVIENRDGDNPYWQSDYAFVHFTFVPPANRAYTGRSIYLFGDLTGYRPDARSKMIFNEEKGVYEKTLFLKQGYYNYSYITLPDKAGETYSIENTEGNYWGTENSYLVLVYFRPFGARADELIGMARLNSVFPR
ncbi:MAG TPA: DUF5103 domain-containing protein [Chitinophagaceae bacterium]|nr:DUF5103 domain-containing protein [Chitinophagaceae bacterium]